LLVGQEGESMLCCGSAVACSPQNSDAAEPNLIDTDKSASASPALGDGAVQGRPALSIVSAKVRLSENVTCL